MNGLGITPLKQHVTTWSHKPPSSNTKKTTLRKCGNVAMGIVVKYSIHCTPKSLITINEDCK